MRPRFVLRVDGEDGRVLWQADEPERRHVLDAAVAYVVTDALEDVLTRGTGTAVRDAGFRAPAAGKTGTTNDGADTWFVGFTPEIVAAVWMGFDRQRPIMAKATGGRLAAPVWARLMSRIYAGRKAPAPWPMPAGVVEGMVDPQTGLLLASGCAPWSGVAYKELFVQGSMPVSVCPSQGPIMTAEMLPLPPLPDYEEGMETGVPLEELPETITPGGMARMEDGSAGAGAAAVQRRPPPVTRRRARPWRHRPPRARHRHRLPRSPRAAPAPAPPRAADNRSDGSHRARRRRAPAPAEDEPRASRPPLRRPPASPSRSDPASGPRRLAHDGQHRRRGGEREPGPGEERRRGRDAPATARP